jgi:hypothetical protein
MGFKLGSFRCKYRITQVNVQYLTGFSFEKESHGSAIERIGYGDGIDRKDNIDSKDNIDR